MSAAPIQLPHEPEQQIETLLKAYAHHRRWSSSSLVNQNVFVYQLPQRWREPNSEVAVFLLSTEIRKYLMAKPRFSSANNAPILRDLGSGYLGLEKVQIKFENVAVRAADLRRGDRVKLDRRYTVEGNHNELLTMCNNYGRKEISHWQFDTMRPPPRRYFDGNHPTICWVKAYSAGEACAAASALQKIDSDYGFPQNLPPVFEHFCALPEFIQDTGTRKNTEEVLCHR